LQKVKVGISAFDLIIRQPEKVLTALSKDVIMAAGGGPAARREVKKPYC